MMNLAMENKIKKAEALDLSGCERTEEGDYIMESDPGDFDLCDAKAERWIWSVGKNKETGQIVASLGTKFYQNPAYDCIWLR